MRISTVREFRDQAKSLLRSKDPILVTRRGRVAGVFFPCPGQSTRNENFPGAARRQAAGVGKHQGALWALRVRESRDRMAQDEAFLCESGSSLRIVSGVTALGTPQE